VKVREFQTKDPRKSYYLSPHLTPSNQYRYVQTQPRKKEQFSNSSTEQFWFHTMPLYEEIEFEDLIFDSETESYSYPCPCGDKFKISLEELWDGEDIADCQSCTLFIKVIYEEEDLPPLREDSDDENEPEKQGTSEGEVTEAVKSLSIK
jgi:diphthamide biosynthesis protein 3